MKCYEFFGMNTPRSKNKLTYDDDLVQLFFSQGVCSALQQSGKEEIIVLDLDQNADHTKS